MIKWMGILTLILLMVSGHGLLLSLSWANDETIDIIYSSEVTVQWCAIEESDPTGHSKGVPHNFGILSAYEGSGNISLHHNLFAHHYRTATGKWARNAPLKPSDEWYLEGLQHDESPVDSDNDGMPDDWEAANGCDGTDGADHNKVMTSGYTAIEEYINGRTRQLLEMEYEMHDPIYIEHQETTEDNPLVIEGYEITNPGGPGIQVLHVDHVIIRNNYIHDCGIEVSNRIRDEILSGRKDARAATMRNPRKTGALNIFDAKTVIVSNNRIVNNDYGIRIHSQHSKTKSVEVSDNIVKGNHRSHFIHIQNANNVDVRNNEVVDNGLSLFIDNEGLVNAFKRGEDWPDGRSQGIMCDTCKNVKIHGNTVINSSSDGIGLGGELDNNDYAENFEIYNNTVMRNGEQGIWIVASRNGKIHDNKVWKNASRPDTTGGSSGISFEAHVYNVDIYNNDVAYNDMLGILITLSTNISIYDNEIHHNADGAIGWGEWFSRKGRVTSEGFSQGINIRNNDIHDNMGSVFWSMTDVFEDNVIVEKNRFYRNGIRIRHYQEFPDHDMSAHPEIWKYDGENILFRENEEQFQSQFRFRDNYIDNELVGEGF